MVEGLHGKHTASHAHGFRSRVSDTQYEALGVEGYYMFANVENMLARLFDERRK